ncbi:hypothetical protein ACFQZZ_23245 [Nocardia sp. GCM10030253]|uniref:hypothetical protein n=1 Tax=Nocardia sp. GCM10030253 TaxID=3273404 RepID=UPI00362978CA
MLSVHRSDVIYCGNDLADYLRHQFSGPSEHLGSAWATAPFWSYLLGDNGGPPWATFITPPDPYAVSPEEAVEHLRMLALERLIGRRVEPAQLIQAGLVALVLDIESESLPLLAGLSRHEKDRAAGLFDQVVDEFDLAATFPADEFEVRHLLVGWWLRQIVNGSLPPAIGGDVIRYEAWAQLGRPDSLRPLLEYVNRYGDWKANQTATPAELAADIVTEAKRLLRSRREIRCSGGPSTRGAW